MAEPKGFEPLTTGQMYIGISTTRAQAANLRWQKVVVFMAMNTVLGTGAAGLLAHELNRSNSFYLLLLLLFSFLINFIWKGLMERANQWIDHYSQILSSMEEVSKDSILVRVFSDQEYLGKETASKRVSGIRFREGTLGLAIAMIIAWAVALLLMFGKIMYLIGQGNF